MMRVCVGGTFNVLHKGHLRLLNKALDISGCNGFLFIGIANGKLIFHKRDVKSFEKRKNQIIKMITQRKCVPTVLIEPIIDRFGPTIENDFDVIVVSEETKATAEEINRIRKQRGKKSIKIVEIPMVYADDGKPISSSRISNGDITMDGRVVHEDKIKDPGN